MVIFNSYVNLPEGNYCGWLQNPSPPNGWLKPYKSWDSPPRKTGAGFLPATVFNHEKWWDIWDLCGFMT
jgi:hypothetical protein